jgi:hypothetical protein
MAAAKSNNKNNNKASWNSTAMLEGQDCWMKQLGVTKFAQ